MAGDTWYCYKIKYCCDVTVSITELEIQSYVLVSDDRDNGCGHVVAGNTWYCYKIKYCCNVTVSITELEIQSYILVSVMTGEMDVVMWWLVTLVLGIATK